MSLALRFAQAFPRSATLNMLRGSMYRADRESILLLWSVNQPDVPLTLDDVRERVEGVDKNLVDGLCTVLMIDGWLSYKSLPDGSPELSLSRRGVSRVKKILQSRMRSR